MRSYSHQKYEKKIFILLFSTKNSVMLTSILNKLFNNSLSSYKRKKIEWDVSIAYMQCVLLQGSLLRQSSIIVLLLLQLWCFNLIRYVIFTFMNFIILLWEFSIFLKRDLFFKGNNYFGNWLMVWKEIGMEKVLMVWTYTCMWITSTIY